MGRVLFPGLELACVLEVFLSWLRNFFNWSQRGDLTMTEPQKPLNKGSFFLVDYQLCYCWAFNLLLAQNPCSHADSIHFTSSQDGLLTVNHPSTGKLLNPTAPFLDTTDNAIMSKPHIQTSWGRLWIQFVGPAYETKGLELNK